MNWAYQPLLPGAAQLAHWTITVDVASFDVDGQSIGLEWANKYDPAQFDIDGQVITLTLSTPIAVDSTAFDVDGQSIAFNTSILVDSAAFDIDGQTVPMDLSVVVTKADLQPAGQDITLSWVDNWTIAVDSATFQIDGQTIPFDLDVLVNVATFDIAGQDITLTWVMGGTDTPITVDSAAFSVSGSAVDLALSTTQLTYSGGWVESEYEKRYARLTDEIRKELSEEQEREALADRLENVLVGEGTLTQAQADLIRLRGLAEQYSRDDLPNRARRALAFAERAKSDLSLKLALRELRRLQEEEELAVFLLMTLD